MLEAFLAEMTDVPEDRIEINRLGLMVGPEGLEELRTRVHDLLVEFAARPAEPDGERLSVHVVLHPERRRRS